MKEEIDDLLYVIEIQRNNRKFFLTPKNQLTWKKESAKVFHSVNEVEEYIRTYNLNYSILWSASAFTKNYEIKKYSEVSSH
jgi:hypothetical protein